jgi:hypothetical protein
MEKILLKQAARIIDHLVEKDPIDIDWDLVDRFQAMLEAYLTDPNNQPQPKEKANG